MSDSCTGFNVVNHSLGIKKLIGMPQEGRLMSSVHIKPLIRTILNPHKLPFTLLGFGHRGGAELKSI